MSVLDNHHNTQVVEYVKYLYKTNSTASVDYPDLKDRKNHAAEKYLTDLDPSQIDAINNLSNQDVLYLINEYLREQHNYEWTALAASEEHFYECTAMLMQPISGLDDDKKIRAMEQKDKLSASLEASITRINTYRRNIFADNKDIEDAKVPLSPEKRIAAKKNN
jgi:hypothetical protein